MSEVKVDTISERTAANGVAVDGVTIKDSGLTIPSGGTLTVASGGTITNSGTATGFSTPSGLASVQTFTSSGTWTRPSDITKVIMEVQGGGASGSAVNYAGGGGAGGYAKKLLDVSSISTSTITVGAGGTSPSLGAAGNAGGNSSWADGTNTITGTGGGSAGTAAYGVGVGGVPTGGDLNLQGASGASEGLGSGISFFGSRGGDNSSGVPDSSVSAGYGGGGGSGWSSYTGGLGSPGIVIVWEYK